MGGCQSCLKEHIINFESNCGSISKTNIDHAKSIGLSGWLDGWVDVKAVLRISYSNKKIKIKGKSQIWCKTGNWVRQVPSFVWLQTEGKFLVTKYETLDFGGNFRMSLSWGWGHSKYEIFSHIWYEFWLVKTSSSRVANLMSLLGITSRVWRELKPN